MATWPCKRRDCSCRGSIGVAPPSARWLKLAAGWLALLEAAWREAEQIAAIADDLLLPDFVRNRLRRSA